MHKYLNRLINIKHHQILQILHLKKKYERKVEFIIDTTSTAINAYKKANLWLAKKLNNSKSAIQIQDEKEFLITSKMSTSCNTINSFIDMDFDFRAKDKKIKVVFENIRVRQDKGNIFSGLIEPYPSSDSQLNDFKQNCLNEMMVDLKKSIEVKSEW